ncbi:DUF6415 family natural product biosynthesis protein [Streptomyces sp. NPDC020379]|uniref:DUF6415 family natural product biosynthesis protein n=1 Tax=Streptomyces sp. NPDC020379 TaxID=3365071 RepID=UPI0037927D9C
MPVCPGTAVTPVGRPDSHHPDGDDLIRSVIRTILGAPSHISPPVGSVSSSTVILRAYIKETAVAVQAAAGALPASDPRREPAERSAAEALHRVNALGPGSGLRSAFDHARGLALAAQELRDQRELLRDGGQPC